MKKRVCYLLLLLIVALTACTQNLDFRVYEGNSLRIAVVGESPKVKEKQVMFTEISFDEMTNEALKSYDAVFIREEQLSEAAEGKYADVYSNSTIPFFFIGAVTFVPFTEKDLAFDKTFEWTVGNSYAVGVLLSKEEESLKNWGFGLHNEIKNEEHMEAMYSIIFMSIDEMDR